MVFDIKGKYALVTGGAQGIGFQISKELLENGVTGLLIVDIDDDKGKETTAALNNQYSGNKVLFIKCDVAQELDLERAYTFAMTNFGGLDLVINNAGVFKDNIWEQEIRINCFSVVKSSLLALKYMGKNNGGRGGVVVNISSIAGLYPVDSMAVYVGTKHFTLGFSRSMGTPFYYNLTGVTFRIICPGVTNTQLFAQSTKSLLDGFPGIDKQLESLIETSFLNQEPEYVAKAIIKSVTEGENGSVWNVEGGQTYELEFPDRLSLRKRVINL